MGKFLIIFVPTHSVQCAQCSEKECKPKGWGSYYYYYDYYYYSYSYSSRPLSMSVSSSSQGTYMSLCRRTKGHCIQYVRGCNSFWRISGNKRVVSCIHDGLRRENYSVHPPCMRLRPFIYVPNKYHIIRTLV